MIAIPTMSFSPEKLEKRRGGLGASDAGPVCGLSPWKGALDVYLEKTDQIGPTDPTEDTERGILLEPSLRTWFAHRHPDLQVTEARTKQHPEIPYIYASADGLVSQYESLLAVLELKAPARTAHHWGKEGTDQIPDYYVAQVTQQMACEGVAKAYVGALLWGSFRVYEVAFHADLWKSIAELEADFWHNNVLKRRPPSFAKSKRAMEWILKRYPEANKEIIVSTNTAEDAAEQLRDTQEHLAAVKERESELKAILAQEIGDGYGVQTSAGKVLYYNKKGRSRTEWMDLVYELGGTDEDIARHTTIDEPSRVLRPYWK